MNFEFAQQINPYLERFDFKKALEIAESALKRIPASDFHEIIGLSLTDQANDLAGWIDSFYKSTSKNLAIKSLYFEMNEFDINTDMWYIDGFAFSKDGGVDSDDMEWLCEYEADTQTEVGTVFVIEGLEELQNAFESVELDNDDLQNARDWSEQIIIARYMELMRAAHLIAKESNMDWGKLPIYFTEHAYDFIIRSDK